MHAAEFARLWMKFSKEWKNYLEEALAPHLTEGQLNVLELLLEHEPMKPSDLLKYLETTPAAITTLLDRMEKGGLITRSRDQSDRRIVWISVTKKGLEEAKRGMELRETYIQNALDRISGHNQQLLVYLLGKVANTSKPFPVSGKMDSAI
ncbi:MarR family winged helix-turn-helix transcriptional regulator [Paenibacillus pinihumi]|uniref:MarR family winged helix-turn-helix transcriptional regulator n=1 Tax=Paenibacillus pinihumi TaxID=669462 RepID=UPI00041322A3|nr:MarR family transcriptional regulator [Paenibacillus pinihumi]